MYSMSAQLTYLLVGNAVGRLEQVYIGIWHAKKLGLTAGVTTLQTETEMSREGSAEAFTVITTHTQRFGPPMMPPTR
jgi:hypothetical protein